MVDGRRTDCARRSAGGRRMKADGQRLRTICLSVPATVERVWPSILHLSRKASVSDARSRPALDLHEARWCLKMHTFCAKELPRLDISKKASLPACILL